MSDLKTAAPPKGKVKSKATGRKKSGTQQRRCGHGFRHYFIEGLGHISTYINYPYAPGGKGEGLPGAYDPETPPDDDRAFRFCQMFESLEKFEPSDPALIALGEAMVETGSNPGLNVDIPAGYTYFGQFVDHDITMDKTEGLPTGRLQADQIVNGRTPGLDLDSLYLNGPGGSPEMYESDGKSFRIGNTTGRTIFGITQSFPNDLPREPADFPDNAGKAIIGDPRNDENLAVAQTHLAFLKFHNKVVADNTDADFNAAREIVTQHYQSIILNDFLPHIVSQPVYDDVLANGRQFVQKGKGNATRENCCMPVEFSVAAYRFGHSMIRNAYEWNRVFNSSGIDATLALLFEFTEVSGNLGGSPTLPSDWIVDWTRFYDFTDTPDAPNHPQSNKARSIDPRLALKLQDLPEFASEVQPHLRSLAVRNLLRGRLVGLPTGQAVASKINAANPLSSVEIASGPHGAVLRANGFDEETPLWYYILKEAQVRHGGQHLGEVGSRIVMETFHAIIECSRHSILKEEGWQPSLPSANTGKFTMPDMIAYVGDPKRGGP